VRAVPQVRNGVREFLLIPESDADTDFCEAIDGMEFKARLLRSEVIFIATSSPVTATIEFCATS